MVSQFFSPNVDPAVIDDLRRRGVLHTQRMYACLFLQRYAALIGDWFGGLALLFTDVWGGFDRGAATMLALSLQLRLIEPSADGGCFVSFAASDRRLGWILNKSRILKYQGVFYVMDSSVFVCYTP